MSLRILLADESSTIKKAFEIGLNSFGAEIKNVQHGIDVLEIAESFKPDIIFADVLISKMNGYEVCAQIKQNKSLNTIPVVLMWSGFMDIDEDKYFTCQADGKIEKPFSADQVLSLIQDLVQKPIGTRNDTHSFDSKPSFDPNGGKPPSLSQLHKETKKPLSPAEELILKEDLKPLNSDLFEDLSGSVETEDDDDFGLEGFQALDLHDDGKDDFDSEFKEITAIPTAEEEHLLLQKINEDTNLRHGFFNSDVKGSNQKDSSNQSINITNFSEIESIDELDSAYVNEDLDASIFDGEDLTSDNHEFDDLFTKNDQKTNIRSKTIHRDVDDIHNSDAGITVSSDDLFEIKTTTENKNKLTDDFSNSKILDSKALKINESTNLLSKEEVKQIVAEQAKEMIQSIIWEMIPELSKQMIEKEIRRLLAEPDDSKPNLSKSNNSF
jgi:CheY-like chemotaxis protein